MNKIFPLTHLATSSLSFVDLFFLSLWIPLRHKLPEVDSNRLLDSSLNCLLAFQWLFLWDWFNTKNESQKESRDKARERLSKSMETITYWKDVILQISSWCDKQRDLTINGLCWVNSHISPSVDFLQTPSCHASDYETSVVVRLPGSSVLSRRSSTKIHGQF